MITSRDRLVALDNLGWVDGGRLWKLDLEAKTESLIEVPGATHLALANGQAECFRVVHHGDPTSRISVRSFQDPSSELAAVHRGPNGFEFTGDVGAWQYVDSAVVIDGDPIQRIACVDWRAREVRALALSWFNGEAFDLGYQGLTGCLSLPGDRHVAVSVQRSSDLVIIDREDGGLVTTIRLGEHGGAGNMQLVSDSELLVTDYDALCRVDLVTRKVIARAVLQAATPPFTRQFIGEYTLIDSGDIALARPFSGDIALVERDSLRLRGRQFVGGQPLTIACAADGTLVSRDWKSGELRLSKGSAIAE